MSFKAIDLQFAVHKNDEAGIKQNQLMQKPRHDEVVLEQHALLETDHDRHRSAKLEESARPDLKDKHEQKRAPQERKARGAASGQTAAVQEDGVRVPVHPYKGHHIDLSL
ncbi:hypothetical protein [Paenibacillus ferrarius]|uniref:hypothetical protein n=1 Tax=Paenibacillus ferrarius TaxID=1469647 RepID=UPI003D2E3CFF